MNDDFISSSMDTGMRVPPDEGGAPGGGGVGGGGDAPSMVSMRGPETYQGHGLKSRFAYVIRQQPEADLARPAVSNGLVRLRLAERSERKPDPHPRLSGRHPREASPTHACGLRPSRAPHRARPDHRKPRQRPDPPHADRWLVGPESKLPYRAL